MVQKNNMHKVRKIASLLKKLSIGLEQRHSKNKSLINIWRCYFIIKI